MSGALNSGMDVLIELSAGFIQRIVRNKLQQMDQGCFTADQVPVKNPLDPDGDPIPLNFRRIQLEVASLSFEQTPGGPVFIVLELDLMYAQVLWGPDDWRSLDELEEEMNTTIDRSFSSKLLLNVSADSENILISVDTSTVPYIPDELGEPVAIPVNFLNQTQTFLDEAGEEQTATLLALTINGDPTAKVLNANTLVIGLDVELSQDDDLRILKPGVADRDPVVAGPDDLVPHHCGLPEQPAVDRLRFDFDFVDSFGAGDDWAIALDAHIVDAILRGAPAAGMNNAGEETEDCEHKDAMMSACIRLDPPLEEDLINIQGGGVAYICTPEFFIPNGYYEINFRADVTFAIEGTWVRARYEVTEFALSILGYDATEILFSLAGREVERSDDRNALRARFGETSDPAGRLTVEEVKIRTDGLVLRGSSSVQPKYRSIAVNDELLFAKGCAPDDEPVTKRLRIRNNGRANLHLCPLDIRKHTDGSGDDVSLFSVTAPEELLDTGEGRTLEPDESVVVTIACTGAAGGTYVAWLDIPNDALSKSVRLDANFLPATLGPMVAELDFGDIDYEWSGCNRPADRSVDIDLELSNEGPGNMEFCTIRFSADVEPAFSATNPRVFRPGPANIRVTFLAPWGVDQEYDGTLTLVTNGGERREIRIRARATTEQDPFGVFNHVGFDRDFACGDADWDRVQDTDGRILDYHEVAELLPILGGEPCCPPPRGPACRCVDLWETAFFDVPAGVGVEVVNPQGRTIANSLAQGARRTVLMPIQEQRSYAMRATAAAPFASMQPSRMSMRRWIAQQDGLYEASQRLDDVAVVGDYAYAVGPRGMEVISLSNPRLPKRVRLARTMAGASCVAALRSHLVVVNDGLRLYSLANPQHPRLVRKWTPKSRLRALLPANTGTGGADALYAFGTQLHVLELSADGHLRELNRARVRVRAQRACQRGHHLYVFGAHGLEVFAATMPEAPRAVGYLPAKRALKNGIVAGTVALAVHSARDIDIVDISDPTRPHVIGDLRLEDWMREFVPVAGSVARYRNQFLLLTNDQRGCRLVRLRPNKVDQDELSRWRARRKPPVTTAVT